MEDLITLEDLREAILPFDDTFNADAAYIPEDDWIDVDDQELSEASTIAIITLMNIFDCSWKKIANRQESREVATNILMEILGRAWKTIKPRSRWRQPEPSSWKRNIAKKRRADGLPYVTAKKNRQAKIPKVIDCSRCRFRCTTKISMDDREKLCRKYWNMEYTAKKNFILNLIKVMPIKTTVVARKRTTQRSNSKNYYFKINGLELQVCQSFFCKTLCISPSVVTNAVTNSSNLGLYSGTGDPRGRHEPKK